MMSVQGLHWFKSSYSANNGGACVEVAADLVASRGVVPVRDSKCVAGPVLTVASTAFAGFVAGVKSGDLSA
ncbi:MULTISPECIES: DUF397 domain-containing protein [Streptomyces]|uniref:DUF397 domain-containing protein n=1 Tax=Streptomyces evansiae TaxID=3075535 RepID=A0ABU2R0P2_9ACTN|nr:MULTISPECIES: DUF397 domain-containing protein [unclassified Streptomyces]EFL02464.1 conserved hypothetical protein [Streptomyces sp. SPB78]MDT0410259.1 DUF397 domain-containing protein [Streptomyces sp. DSM 41979]MYQ58879.1 DUF397 domain-containing protein [Streptomyces sp. SID4926]SCE05479.1 protein of unknown function [Streptomyces sp. DfronAA-171]